MIYGTEWPIRSESIETVIMNSNVETTAVLGKTEASPRCERRSMSPLREADPLNWLHRKSIGELANPYQEGSLKNSRTRRDYDVPQH